MLVFTKSLNQKKREQRFLQERMKEFRTKQKENRALKLKNYKENKYKKLEGLRGERKERKKIIEIHKKEEIENNKKFQGQIREAKQRIKQKKQNINVMLEIKLGIKLEKKGGDAREEYFGARKKI